MANHIAKVGLVAYSPDFQHNDVPEFNGGDGLYAGGYREIAGGRFLAKAADGKPQPLFSEASLYGIGLSRVAPFKTGNSYIAGDQPESRWMPPFGFAGANQLLRPCRTLIVRGVPPGVTGSDLYSQLNDSIQPILDLHVIVQATRFSLPGSAGYDQYSPPLAALFPKESAGARAVQNSDGAGFPVFDYPDLSSLRGGEALVIDYWQSAISASGGTTTPPPFVYINATIDNGTSTSDGIGDYNCDVALRVTSDPVPDGETFVYLASFEDIFTAGRIYANSLASRFSKYSHVVFRPAPADFEGDAESGIIERTIEGYDFAEDAGPASADAASAVADIVQRARDFFSPS